MSYNRYNEFNINGEINRIPFVKLPLKPSDKEIIYQKGITRFDLLSNKYYKDPNYGWLILLANPEYGSLEFNIENNSKIVIPFPLEASLNDYKGEINKYIKYYGVKI